MTELTWGPENGGAFTRSGNEFAVDDNDEIKGKPHQNFDWQYTDNDREDDAKVGLQEDGTFIYYTREFYSFDELEFSGCWKFTMHIRNQPNFHDRDIKRYMSHETRNKYMRNGVTEDYRLWGKGETRDDMEYFMRKLKAAEANYDDDYVSPIT